MIKCLGELNIPTNVINVIRWCVSTARMSLIWNGDKGDSFTPTRGLRQRDPLSPYLFVILMEKFSHVIQKEVENDNWQPFRMRKNGTCVSHLFSQMICSYLQRLTWIRRPF